MDEPLGLEGLHDIVLPPMPPLWPPGDGFWVALLLLGLVLVVGWRWRRQWQRRNAYRVAGLGRLAKARTVYDVSVVLKRVALAAWPREQVASLSGMAWARYLNASCPRCRFADDAFARPDELAGKVLQKNAARWIRRHRVETADLGAAT